MSTLPSVVADLDGTGHAWYAARFGVAADTDARNVIWRPVPTLLDGTMRWATDDDHIGTPHLTLDLTTCAELLYAAPVDVTGDTDTDALAELILGEAARWHCNLAGPIALLAQEAGDHPEDCARRMTRCICAAARLLQVEV